MSTYLDTLKFQLQQLIDLHHQANNKNSENVKDGHGFDHMLAVMNHAILAVDAPECQSLSPAIKDQIIFAALLHDADEDKIFGVSDEANSNARRILLTCLDDEYLKSVNYDSDLTSFIEQIIELINLVSCSKNKDSNVAHSWMLIPRDCDRLEAIGDIGIQRCDEYSKSINAPVCLDDTPKVYNYEELWAVATPQRFAKNSKSQSKIDHYYDKLLHIGKPECLKSQKSYILAEANKRNSVMADYVINFFKQNFPKAQ